MIRACSLVALVTFLTASTAADWSRFRGPNGTGVAEGKLPDIDPAKPLWKTPIPGKGVGSPVIVSGKVYLQAAPTDNSRALMCLDAKTGKTEWSKEIPGTKAIPNAKNSLASGTPAVAGERIFCAWWDGTGVSATGHDLTGKQLWSTSLGGYKSQHGPGFSPMVHGDLVFVNVDDDVRAELVALDAATGAKKWIAPRKKYRASYATPFLLERPGKGTELILGTTTALTSYEPATGKVNWEYALEWPKEGGMPLRVVGHPVYAAGLLIVYTGDGGGARYMVAIDPDKPKPEKVWELKNTATPYVPCVIVKGDRLFWIGDKGIATYADAKTGKKLWSERVFPVDVTASPVLVGNEVLLMSEKSELAVLELGAKFVDPEKRPLGEGAYATPAVADGRVFVRGEKHLFCFGK
jgi:outer membrane protein assembly factor BamB